ncbi:hypothetical protein ES703_101902 [subsurface metagenome]
MPGLAAIIAFHQVGFEVPLFMIVQHGVNRVHIMTIRLDVIDECFFRDAVNPFHFSPGPACVFSHLDETIIRADVNKAFLQRRFGDGSDIAVL